MTERVEASRKLSTVLADIGVTEDIVKLRQKVGVERASMTNLMAILLDFQRQVFNFGSQSEGKCTGISFFVSYP